MGGSAVGRCRAPSGPHGSAQAASVPRQDGHEGLRFSDHPAAEVARLSLAGRYFTYPIVSASFLTATWRGRGLTVSRPQVSMTSRLPASTAWRTREADSAPPCP